MNDGRRLLAVFLIGVLGTVVTVSSVPLVFLAFGTPDAAARQWDVVKEWLQVVFLPLLPLLANVLSYYFGRRAK